MWLPVRSVIRSPLTVSRDPERTVVRFPAEVDVRNASMIRERLLRLLNRGTGPLILDLTSTRFCDCAGVRAIMRAHRRASGLGTPIRVAVAEDGPVRRIASLTGLTATIPVRPDVAEACASLTDDPLAAPRSTVEPT